MQHPIISRTREVRKCSLFLFAIIVVLLSLPLSLAAQRRERVIDSWRPIHYDVALSFNDQLTEISAARTEITLEVLAADLTKIDLDLAKCRSTR